MNSRIAICMLIGCAAYVATDCRAEVSIGLHAASIHLPAKDRDNNDNLGLYAKGERWAAGGYRNTIGRTSLYGAYVQPIGGRVDLMVGAVSGYQRKCESVPVVVGRESSTEHRADGSVAHAAGPVIAQREQCTGFSRAALTPMAGATYSVPIKFMGASPRIWLLPGTKHSRTVVHLSLEAAL